MTIGLTDMDILTDTIVESPVSLTATLTRTVLLVCTQLCFLSVFE